MATLPPSKLPPRRARAAKIVADARSEFERARSGIPGLAKMLNETGLGNNEWLIERLALKARARSE